MANEHGDVTLLRELASSNKPSEEAERIPAEVWRGAYQRRLLDNDATL